MVVVIPSYRCRVRYTTISTIIMTSPVRVRVCVFVCVDNSLHPIGPSCVCCYSVVPLFCVCVVDCWLCIILSHERSDNAFGILSCHRKRLGNSCSNTRRVCVPFDPSSRVCVRVFVPSRPVPSRPVPSLVLVPQLVRCVCVCVCV